LPAEDLGEQPSVLGCVDTVYFVVGAHDRPRPRLGDHSLETLEIDLPQGPSIDLRIRAHSVVLGVVGREVFDRCADAVALQSADPRRAEHTAEMRVLGVVLEVAAAAGIALDVHAGS
jgi:hypothetical protein